MIKDLQKDIVRYVPSQVVPGIVGFISIPIITRLFPPADYGHYTLVMAAVMILTTLVGWLPMSIVRFYAAYERDGKLGPFYDTIINLTLVSILALALISLTLLFSIKGHLSSQLYSLMHVGLGVFAVTALFDVFQYFLRVKRHVTWYSAFAASKSIASFGIALLFIFSFRTGVASLLWGSILAILLALPLCGRRQNTTGLPVDE